jgi:hypothetical protein
MAGTPPAYLAQPAGLHKYDRLPPEAAVVHAWTDVGAMPRMYLIQQEAVRGAMPALGRALDRLCAGH